MSGGRPSTGLTFHWPERDEGTWSLPVLVLASIALHSSAFFLFQAKDEGFRAPPRSAPSVQLLTPFGPDGGGSRENEALLQWVATQDPALVAQIPGVEPKGLLDVRYRPSFHTLRTPPLSVPPEPATVQFPPPRDPLALIRSVTPARKPKLPEFPSQPTRVTVSAALATRAPKDLPMIPAARTDTAVEPTSLLVGITADGEVRFSFPQHGSGSAALDSEAAAFVEKIHFTPAPGPVEWGTVSFIWGDDAIASQPHAAPPR
jgi:hypothetical protein